MVNTIIIKHYSIPVDTIRQERCRWAKMNKSCSIHISNTQVVFDNHTGKRSWTFLKGTGCVAENLYMVGYYSAGSCYHILCCRNGSWIIFWAGHGAVQHSIGLHEFQLLVIHTMMSEFRPVCVKGEYMLREIAPLVYAASLHRCKTCSYHNRIPFNPPRGSSHTALVICTMVLWYKLKFA